MKFWEIIGVLYLTALACSSLGFFQYIWFISIGYGVSVAGIAFMLTVLAFMTNRLTIPLGMALLVVLLAGLRLSLFLYKRQINSESYQLALKERLGKEPSLVVKILVWLLVSSLYVCEMTGLIVRVIHHSTFDVWFWVGVLIMIAGALLETVADHQKFWQKTGNPHLPAMEDLYAWVRCPNYLGEMVFWTGVFLSGLNAYVGWREWVAALSGWVSIMIITILAAKRLEQGHEAKYGLSRAYRLYADSTPILFPFLPLYHLNSKRPKPPGSNAKR